MTLWQGTLRNIPLALVWCSSVED